MVNFATALATFAIIFSAELPDKSMLAALVIGTRNRASYVYAGVAAAFAIHVLLAVIVGKFLTLLPTRPLEIIVGLMFAAGALCIPKERGGAHATRKPALHLSRQPSFWRVAGIGFIAVFIPEFGDLTQIATANLAAAFNG